MTFYELSIDGQVFHHYTLQSAAIRDAKEFRKGAPANVDKINVRIIKENILNLLNGHSYISGRQTVWEAGYDDE